MVNEKKKLEDIHHNLADINWWLKGIRFAVSPEFGGICDIEQSHMKSLKDAMVMIHDEIKKLEKEGAEK